MSEIDHKTTPLTAAKMAATVVQQASQIPNLEAEITRILEKKKQQQQQQNAAGVEEPDWSKISEAEAYNPAVSIPVIDHDVPDYMNMKLKDDEYMCVWANKDQRRLGALLAEGYEILKKEHVHPDYQVPLMWSSEGTYEYADVICMRVHKRVIFAKRRKAYNISMKQLANVNRPPMDKRAYENGADFTLDSGMGFYE